MKHRAFLRRSLPLLSLTVLLLTFALPTYALFGIGEEAEAPSVAAFSKNGPAGSAITFSAEDFVVQSGGALDSIVISTLPDQAAGILTLGGQPLNAGDVVAMNAVSGLSFQPLTASAVTSARFTFTPVFSDGTSGSPVEVGLHLLSEANNAPIAENLELCTYKNVAITASFAATDPEGDLITFQLVDKPARGAVTMPEGGSNEFVYTPYENKTGKDSFTYVAVDAVGNTSAPATVKVKIEKASTKVTYSDMDGVSAHKAAIRLAEEGIFVGECMGGEYFFNPDTPVSRSEFLTMTMKATGLDALEDVTTTGFADDTSIPGWARPYVASALKNGLVQGTLASDGQVVFQPANIITRAEASVLLNRVLRVTDVAQPTFGVDLSGVPDWAVQPAANLESCGVLQADGNGSLGLSSTLTRAEAAELLSGALDVLESRESGSWFPW